MKNVIDYILAGEYDKFYNSRPWRRKAQEARKRDNFECQECKKEGKVKTSKNKNEKVKLEVHHKIQIKVNPYLALDINNLVTLCTHHHNLVHGKDKMFDNRERKKTFRNEERW